MTTSRRPTITDVATEAGVATSTVSRAFSNPGRVNEHTRRQIVEVAERLGYVPNPAARAMRSGRTDTVALLVPDITNYQVEHLDRILMRVIGDEAKSFKR